MKNINVSSAHSAAGPGLWGRMEPRGDGVLVGSGLAGCALSRRPQTAGRQEKSAYHRKGDQWLCGVQQIGGMASISWGQHSGEEGAWIELHRQLEDIHGCQQRKDSLILRSWKVTGDVDKMCLYHMFQSKS